MSPISCCLYLALAIVSLAPIEPSLAGPDELSTRKAYEKMESCLAKKWNEAKDLDENMKLIDRCMSLNLVGTWTGEYPVKEVGAMMKQLARLTDDESMCFSNGYEIIKGALKHSTSRRPYLMRLVKGLIVKNAEYCEPIFASLAQRSTDDGLTSTYRQSFRKFTSNLTEEIAGKSVENLGPFLVEQIESNSINLRDYIKQTFGSKNDSIDFKSVMHRTALGANLWTPKYAKYIEDYNTNRIRTLPDDFSYEIITWLVQPCGDFVEAMDNRKVFQMASLQSKVLQRNFKWVPYHNKSIETTISDLASFYKDWIRYEVCKTYALAYDILPQVQETRKMILGQHNNKHEFPHYLKVKFPDTNIVKLDELIE